MNKKILAIAVHPNLSGNFSKGDIKKSFASNVILHELESHPDITIHKLGEAYPDRNIDVKREQDLLINHNHILLIGPIFWYGLPAIAKRWIDDVLLYGWAYGSEGKELTGKTIQLVLTSGSALSEYSQDDIGNTIEELFSPYQRSFEYCGMLWKPIKFIGGINSDGIATRQEQLTSKLRMFAKDLINSI